MTKQSKVKELWGFIGLLPDGREELLAITPKNMPINAQAVFFGEDQKEAMIYLMTQERVYSPEVKKIKLVRFREPEIMEYWDFGEEKNGAH